MSPIPTHLLAGERRVRRTPFLPLQAGKRRGSATVAVVFALATTASALAASGRHPAPTSAFRGAPAEYTHFSPAELTRGFMALAFGSDLRIGATPRGIRRFDRPIRVRVFDDGSVDRVPAMTHIIGEYADKVPRLQLDVTDVPPTDIEIRLIDEKNFKGALRAAFGIEVAETFIKRTDPQCMTSVKSSTDGDILRSVTFIIVDKGKDVFLDCAYHELLHAFGLSNHDQRNPWTTLNQHRMVGYLTVYDRALLTMLYDPRIRPGMTREQVRAALPAVIADIEVAAPPRGR